MLPPCHTQLPLIECLDRRLDGADGVEQISIEQPAVFAAHHSRLGTDEPLLLQAADIFGDSVFAHTHRLADGLVAGVALEGLPVLCTQQVAVDSDLSRAQPQDKNFIWNREKVLERFPLRPLLKLHKIPPDIFLSDACMFFLPYLRQRDSPAHCSHLPDSACLLSRPDFSGAAHKKPLTSHPGTQQYDIALI